MVGGQRHAPAALIPGNNTLHYVKEVGWDSGPFLTDDKNLTPTGIRSLTVQAIVSSYTDWAIPDHCVYFHNAISSHPEAAIFSGVWQTTTFSQL